MRARVDRSWLYGAVTAVLLLWLALSSYHTLERVMRMYDPLPNWDYWDVLNVLTQDGHFRPAELWRQHNDHRILFPQLVFAADLLWAHGRQILPICISAFSYLFVWFALGTVFAKDRNIPAGDRVAVVVLSCLMCTWATCSFALAVPFLLQWTLTSAAAVVALLAITSAPRSARALAGVIAAAVVATYSSANGMLIWPLLIVTSFILKLNPRRKLTISCASAASIILYFVDYRFSSAGGVPVFLSHPLYTLEWIAVYMAMPFGALTTPALSIGIGLTSFFVAITCGVLIAQKRLLRSETVIVLFGFYLFSILTAAVSAWGRAIPSDGTFQSATAFRYISVPQQAWAVLTLISVWTISRANWSLFSPVLANATVVLFLFLGLPKTTAWMRSNDLWWFSQEQLGSLAIQSGISDPKLLTRICLDMGHIAERCRTMRNSALSVYSPGSQAPWLGRPLSAYKKVASAPTPGAITYSFPVQSAIEIAGWADRRQTSFRPEKLVFADEHGRIVGFGRAFGVAMPPNFPSSSVPESIGWVGFANLTYGGKRVSAYLVRGDHLDPLAGSISAPDIQSVNQASVGRALSGVDWPAANTWPSMLPPNIETGAPPEKNFHASWNGSDANVGELASSPFEASGCIVVPVLHGEFVVGLSAEIRDPITGQVIAAVPLQDNDSRWEYWRIPVPAEKRHIQIKASDRSTSSGGWIAVATPHECSALIY